MHCRDTMTTWTDQAGWMVSRGLPQLEKLEMEWYFISSDCTCKQFIEHFYLFWFLMFLRILIDVICNVSLRLVFNLSEQPSPYIFNSILLLFWEYAKFFAKHIRLWPLHYIFTPNTDKLTPSSSKLEGGSSSLSSKISKWLNLWLDSFHLKT